MSDEHKPHDPADDGQNAPAAPENPPVATQASTDASTAEPDDEAATEASAQTAPQAEAQTSAGVESVLAEPAPEPAGPDAAVQDQGAEDPSAEDKSGGAEAMIAAGAAAAVGAGMSVADRRPVWSDEGDAPFEETSSPIYDRKARRSGTSRSGKGGKAESAGSETLEIIKTVGFALLIALVLRVLLFQPFTIPSASMEPNLYEGDYIVVTKWSYGYSRHSIPFSPPIFQGRVFGSAPERGDVAVFKLPRDNSTDYIKRVIGLPGDRVQMLNNVLHINGQPVPDVVIERAQIEDIFGPRPVTRSRETLPGGRSFTVQDFGPGGDLDDTPLYVVPAGHYFMMGDNRDNSIDSRVEMAAGVGMVPEENLVGKAQIILFSWSPGASLFNPVSWFANIRPSRFFTVLD